MYEAHPIQTDVVPESRDEQKAKEPCLLKVGWGLGRQLNIKSACHTKMRTRVRFPEPMLKSLPQPGGDGICVHLIPPRGRQRQMDLEASLVSRASTRKARVT